MPHPSSLPLRRLAVHVEEARAGAFRWVLSELDDSDALVTLQRAGTAAGTYHAAMAQGLRALEALIDDLDIGPRLEDVADSDSQAAADALPAGAERDAAGPQRPKPSSPSGRRSAFGFGLPS
ncbi:hypothetical protein [Variovorax saccharolyticus]|uniref:hypothetical protein n=1 Tax=Variovorax saccharolyticus TaxID=3053516 RepID=UPI00257536D9|nr:hypothetical protein [Variovorax sp. J31P216]MDM0029569.1 hypothetical protein [Variovorax sp. J31P216]